jgi:flagellin-like hook-associated protein FlgL
MSGSTTVLSFGVRNSLLSLQTTQNNISLSQQRLSTGKRINSALDNPSAFFTAAGLSQRGKDLSRLQDDQNLALKTLEASDKGIRGVTALVEQAQGLARQALQTSDATIRASLATQFGVIRTQIDQLAGDAGYNGRNLVNSSTANNLVVTFNETNTSSITIAGVDIRSATTGLNISAAAGTWATDANISAAQTELNAAVIKLRSNAATFGANLAIVQNRVEFTKGLINTLNAGSDVLTLADINEEGANLLALQTRQQLGIQALSLASQSDQAVLRLFN